MTNLYGQPDVTSISGETTPYKEIQLYDDVISTRGSASGTHIGLARARTIEYNSGTVEIRMQFTIYIFLILDHLHI